MPSNVSFLSSISNTALSFIQEPSNLEIAILVKKRLAALFFMGFVGTSFMGLSFAAKGGFLVGAFFFRIAAFMLSLYKENVDTERVRKAFLDSVLRNESEIRLRLEEVFEEEPNEGQAGEGRSIIGEVWAPFSDFRGDKDANDGKVWIQLFTGQTIGVYLGITRCFAINGPIFGLPTVRSVFPEVLDLKGVDSLVFLQEKDRKLFAENDWYSRAFDRCEEPSTMAFPNMSDRVQVNFFCCWAKPLPVNVQQQTESLSQNSLSKMVQYLKKMILRGKKILLVPLEERIKLLPSGKEVELEVQYKAFTLVLALFIQQLLEEREIFKEEDNKKELAIKLLALVRTVQTRYQLSFPYKAQFELLFKYLQIGLKCKQIQDF